MYQIYYRNLLDIEPTLDELGFERHVKLQSMDISYVVCKSWPWVDNKSL